MQSLGDALSSSCQPQDPRPLWIRTEWRRSTQGQPSIESKHQPAALQLGLRDEDLNMTCIACIMVGNESVQQRGDDILALSSDWHCQAGLLL